MGILLPNRAQPHAIVLAGRHDPNMAWEGESGAGLWWCVERHSAKRLVERQWGRNQGAGWLAWRLLFQTLNVITRVVGLNKTSTT